MVKKRKNQKKVLEKTAQNFGKIFSEFGEAIGSIFKDSKLKEETIKAGQNISSAARTLVGRFSDKEVKKQFKDVGRAAEKFGKNVAKAAKPTIKKVKKEITKSIKKATKKPVKK